MTDKSLCITPKVAQLARRSFRVSGFNLMHALTKARSELTGDHNFFQHFGVANKFSSSLRWYFKTLVNGFNSKALTTA